MNCRCMFLTSADPPNIPAVKQPMAVGAGGGGRPAAMRKLGDEDPLVGCSLARAPAHSLASPFPLLGPRSPQATRLSAHPPQSDPQERPPPPRPCSVTVPTDLAPMVSNRSLWSCCPKCSRSPRVLSPSRRALRLLPLPLVTPPRHAPPGSWGKSLFTPHCCRSALLTHQSLLLSKPVSSRLPPPASSGHCHTQLKPPASWLSLPHQLLPPAWENSSPLLTPPKCLVHDWTREGTLLRTPCSLTTASQPLESLLHQLPCPAPPPLGLPRLQ